MNQTDNFIYKLPNNSLPDDLASSNNPASSASQPMNEEIITGLIGQSMRNQTERMIMASGTYQSQNFLTGSSGWQIDSLGNAEFNNGTFRGTFKIGGTLITVSDIANLASAIMTVSTGGGGTVALVPNTYTATQSYSIPSNVIIDGNGATIDFGGNAYQFNAVGTNAYSTGTLAVNFGSGSVTGTGTTWTSGMVGQSILIGDYWYIITARASNTAITISPTFEAPSVSGVTYVIATTVDGIGLKNITLTNASGVLFRYRYVQGLVMDGLITTSGGQGIDGDDSNGVQWLNSQTDTCITGITFDNVPFCTFSNGNILNITGGTGLALTGISNTSIGIISIQNITGVGIKFTNSLNLGLINYSIIECSSHGVEFVSGNSDIDLDSGYVNSCGGDGIKFTASSNRIEVLTTNLLNNTGWGVNIANSNCNNNIISANAFANNTAGNLTDSGTATKIRGNQGVSDNIVEGDLSLTDITTNNVSASKHGFVPKFPNNTTTFLRGDGTYATVSNTFVNGTTTKDASDASTTQTIAHGLGRTPVKIRITALSPGVNFTDFKSYAYAMSVYNGTTQSSISIHTDSNNTPQQTLTATFILGAANGAGTNGSTGVITFDATNISIAWTKAGSPTGIYQLLWEAE